MDEMFVSIGGKRVYLWRAVDHEGEVLDCLVQSRRNKRAAIKLMRKLLKKQGFVPTTIVTDHLAAYVAAMSDLRLTCPFGGDQPRAEYWSGSSSHLGGA